jgi:hypothetical protein
MELTYSAESAVAHTQPAEPNSKTAPAAQHPVRAKAPAEAQTPV